MTHRHAPAARPSDLRPSRAILAVASLVACMGAGAQDAAGAADSPLISRFQGSRLTFQQAASFVHVDLPVSYDYKGQVLKETMALEGARERRAYLAPPGHSVLEVHRAYVGALAAAGTKRLLSCEQGQPCTFGAMLIKQAARSELVQQHDAGTRAFDHMDPSYHASFQLLRGGQTHYVTIMSTGSGDAVATLIDIVTPKAADDGGVKVVDANAIAQGLKSEGKMAIYGVNFDTGKAEIRSDSKPQLAEMAKILDADPKLKVFIVGHTDNQGDFDANLALSQKRAEAVVAALVKDYGIAGARLRAAGDANTAPVSSNASEAGRARNRRVEMVIQ